MLQGVNATSGLRKRVHQLLEHEAVSDVLLPFLVLRTALFLIGLGAMRVFPNTPGFHAHAAPVFDALVRWDAIYYLRLAQDGYGGPADAFFPVFPSLVRAAGLVMPLVHASVLVANVANVMVLLLLHRWVRGEAPGGRALARGAVRVALLFPTSFFLGVPYAESTYLVFLLGAFVAHREHRLWTAAVCVAFACLARPQGFLCATLPFVVSYLTSKPKRLRDAPWFTLASLMALAGLFAIHLHASGDALGFLHARTVQSLGAFRQAREAAPPAFYLVLWDEGFGPNLVRRVLNWSALGLVSAATVTFARRRKFAEATLCVTSLAVPLYFHRTVFDAASMARYALLAFPIFPWVAEHRSSEERRLYMDTTFAMAQLVLFCAYTGWYWVE